MSATKLVTGKTRNALQAQRDRRGQNKAQREQTKTAVRTARTARRTQRTNAVTAQKTGIQRLNIPQKVNQMRAYKEYCEELTQSYQTKHREVEDATRMIKDIKNLIDDISVDVLANLTEMENIANNNNAGSELGDSEGEELRLENIEQLLAELIALIPGDTDTDSKKEQLESMIEQQRQMTQERNTHNRTLSQKIGEVKTQIARIQTVGSSGQGGRAAAAPAARNSNPRPDGTAGFSEINANTMNQLLSGTSGGQANRGQLRSPATLPTNQDGIGPGGLKKKNLKPKYKNLKPKSKKANQLRKNLNRAKGKK